MWLGINTKSVKLIHMHGEGTMTVPNYGASYNFELFFILVYKRLDHKIVGK